MKPNPMLRKAHTHVYVEHATQPDRIACRICGWSLARRHLATAVAVGAKDETSLSLSAAVSLALKLVADQAMIDEDLRAFHAPSECWPDAYAGEQEKAATIARRAGFASFDAFLDELVLRTSYRWVYMSGLSQFSDGE